MADRPTTTSIELADVSALTVHPRNPRQGNLAAIKASIDANGFVGALIVQRSTHRVLAGNHRLLAARELGMDRVPVLWADVDDEEALRILLVDNRTSDLATQSEGDLADLLGRLMQTDAELAGTGYGTEDLDDLLAKLEEPLDLDSGPTDARHAPQTPRGVAQPSNRAQGLRTIILAIPDFADFEAHVAFLRRTWQLSSVRDVVLAATRVAAEDVGG